MKKKEDEPTLCVEVGGKWRITADRYCYALQRIGVRKSASKNAGSVYFVTEGYYKTIEDVLNTILEKSIRDGGNKSLTELIKIVKQTRKDIHGYYEELVGNYKDR